MKLNRIIFTFIIFFSNVCYAQYIHLGLQFTKTEYSYHINHETYYFSDSKNSNLTASDIRTTTSNPFRILLPTIYLKYNSKNNFFAKYAISTFYPKIYIDYNYSDYFMNMTTKSSTHFTMTQLAQSLIAGYRVRNTKMLKPFFYGGLATKIYLAKEDFDLIDNAKYIYTAIRPISTHCIFGTGIEYRGFSIDISYETNILPLEKTNNPFYKKYTGINFSLSADIVRFNLISNKNIRKLNEIKRISNLF